MLSHIKVLSRGVMLSHIKVLSMGVMLSHIKAMQVICYCIGTTSEITLI